MERLKAKALALAEKLLSFKFVIFAITCVMRCAGAVGSTEWTAVAGMVLAGHCGMKALHLSKGQEECGG